MRNNIRILIVEDVASDVTRIQHELREGGLNFRSKKVTTRKEFVFELENRPPDVILSDLMLQSFDGFAALAIAKEKCPDLPFIFVTDSLGEEVAIKTFKHGATDYVLKDHLSSLTPAVKRALHEAEKVQRQHSMDTEMQRNEERFRLVMDGIKDYAIFMLDRSGCVIYWNTGAQSIYGWSASEVMGRNFSLFYRAEDVAQRKPELALQSAAADGRFTEESWRVGKNKKMFMASVVLIAVWNGNGRMRGYTQVTRDITTQRQAEEEIRRSESLKTFILESAQDAIILIDAGGKIQEWNPAAQRIFGYTRKEAVGKSPDTLIGTPGIWKTYHEGLTDYLMTSAGSLIGRPVELTLKRADGHEFPAELSISHNVMEKPPRCTAIVRDITERKLAELALRESEERYRLLVNDMKDYAIYMLDSAGCIKTWNTGAERIEGYRAEEIIGKPWATLFTPEDVEAGLPQLLITQAKKKGKAINEGWRLRKGGYRYWSQGVITALRDKSGKLRGFSKLAHDITLQKLAAEKIHKLNEELELRVAERTAQLKAANKELESFSYSISHDLRAPLLRISGFVDSLQSEAAAKLDEIELKHLKYIDEGARQMSDLIDALLDFSRMGRAEMRLEKVAMTRLVAEAQRELRRDFVNRKVEWRIGVLPDARGDPLMLRQVVINLISNALKYTRSRRPAKIEIGSTTEGGETVYFIRDNGVGFDMKYAGKLFGVFQRLHPSREFEGTGIGLANVQRILHRHGGRAWAKSVVGQGATFYFTVEPPP